MNDIFFYGVVENIVDPMKADRVQVRFFGLHTDEIVQDDTTGIPTSDLAWATVGAGTDSASVSGIGKSPHGLVQGTWVAGIFRDRNHQSPLIICSIPGTAKASADTSKGFNDPAGIYPLADRLNEPDVNRLARNEHIEKTIIPHKKENVLTDVQVANDGAAWSEPATKYAAVYPHNVVHETTSGHIMEVDDTPGAERLHTYHKSGTFTEYHPDGSLVTKVVKDNYTIVYGDNNIAVTGRVNITCVGDCNIFTHGNLNVDSVGDMNFHATGNINFEAKNIKSSAQLKYDIASQTSEYNVNAALKVKGGTFDLTGVTAAKITSPSMDLKSSVKMALQSDGPLTITGVPATINAGGTASPATPPTVTPDYSNPTASLFGSYDTAVSTELGSVHAGPAARNDDVIAETQVALTKPVATVIAACGLSVTDPIDYEMVISGPFKLKDFCKLTFAGHHTVQAQNGFTVQQIVCNLKALCDNILIPLSTQFPGMRINSGFRSGTAASQHNRGMAADLSWPGVASGAAAQAHMQAVGNWAIANLPFDQMISEKSNSMWLHLSFDATKTTQRKMVMSTPTGKPPYTHSFVAYSGSFGGTPLNNPPENLF